MELIVIYETGGVDNVKLYIDTADMGCNLCTKNKHTRKTYHRLIVKLQHNIN